MDLNSARIFANVVQKGSFSKAAKTMNIPVATVSRRVADLESSLDVILLERTTRKLRLTQSGATLYDFVSRGIEEIDLGLLALMEQEQSLTGRLRLSLPPDFMPMWALIDDFRTLYANIQIEIFNTDRKIDFIEDGLDLVLRIGDVEGQTSVARNLTSYRHLLVASTRFLEDKCIESAKDISQYPCAAWGKKDKSIVWCLGKNKIEISPFLRSNDYRHMMHIALNNNCITELPPFFCQEHLASGELLEVLPNEKMPEQQVNLVYPSRKSTSIITKKFIDYCVENFKL